MPDTGIICQEMSKERTIFSLCFAVLVNLMEDWMNSTQSVRKPYANRLPVCVWPVILPTNVEKLVMEVGWKRGESSPGEVAPKLRVVLSCWKKAAKRHREGGRSLKLVSECCQVPTKEA